tara:strand:+ start:1724 stop:2200 length:477 start_codon:yes stop_codon:yes gene_type:complete
MRFWNSLLNSFTKKPRNATEFIEKFIRDSKKCRVQLEILRDYEILIQTDALRFTPSWFKVFNINENEFKNGFVIFFILDQKGIEKNEKFIRYKNSNLDLVERNELIDKSPIRTFAKFIKETNDPVFLGKEMKKIIDGIFDSSESDPQALFNLRYIEEK